MTVTNAITASNTAAPEIIVINGQPLVTSRQIAEDFEKSHKNVIRDIEDAAFSPAFRESNIEASEYNIEGQTRKYKQYLLTRDGFTIIAMGYDGEKAMAFKEAYITAFNEMEKALAGEVPIITAVQLQSIREAVANCTRYMKHQSQSFSSTLYIHMKADIGYQKIERLPQAKYDSVISYIRHYEGTVREVWKLSSYLEREFMTRMKERNVPEKDDMASVLVSYQGVLGQGV